MEWYVTLALFMGSFLFLMMIGIPVVYSFLFTNVVWMYLLMGQQAGLQQLVLSIYDSLSLFALLPITLFILMGNVMFRSNVASNMLNALDVWIGRVPGRLSIVAVLGGAVSAALSGSSIGTTAMLGATLTPQMERQGYKKPMSLGPILGSGGLSIMIPPTSLGIILAVIARISVGQLLLAIIIPGLLMAALYLGYVVIRCTLQPQLAPRYEVPPTPFSQKIILTCKYILPLSFIVFLVVGLIFLGVATPTEAAALGTLGTVLLAALYGGLTVDAMRTSLESTLRISVMVLAIMGGAQAFSQVLAFTGANRHLVSWVANLPLSPLAIIILMLVVILFLGGFVSGIPLMMLTMPVFIPVVNTLGFNLLLFAVLVLITVEMSQTTPPYGILLFVMKGVAPPDTTMKDLVLAVAPFLLCDLIAMVLIILYPPIVLWIPGVSFGR